MYDASSLYAQQPAYAAATPTAGYDLSALSAVQGGQVVWVSSFFALYRFITFCRIFATFERLNLITLHLFNH